MSTSRRFAAAVTLSVAVASCKSTPPSGADLGATGGVLSSVGGATVGAGGSVAGSGTGGTAALAGSGGATLPEPVPKVYPVPGFESCMHAEVKADCTDGWCKLPPSCFVMGSPEGEWHRAREDEDRVVVTLTHAIEVQHKELTRAEWTSITGLDPRGPESCTEAACPVAMVSWWDAVHAANLLSGQKDLDPCYEPVGCTGSLGWDLACTGMADPDRSVYECEGYRLPTRAEAEYAARAGTWSTFYSGDITEYADSANCLIDPALEKIGWYCFNSGNRAHVGGELGPNGFGIYDLIGNLGEWNHNEDRFAPISGGADPGGTTDSHTDRFIFGGQYDVKSYLARPANLFNAPWGTHGQRTGFRLVRSLPD